MSERSFEKFDYALRPNKNVERKMIFRSLRELEPYFAISSYRYLGLGSLWFTDFLLAHKELHIHDMTTMEREKSRAKRIEFNRPLACINVVMKSTTEALPIVLNDERAILWLDYDGGVDAALSGDLEISLGKLSCGSFLIVTVNAEVGQLSKVDPDKMTIPKGKVLAELTGDMGWESRENEINRKDFPGIVASLLLDRLKSIVLQYRPGLEFEPIWNFRYADGAPMVTVGGMIGDGPARMQLAKGDLGKRFPFITCENVYEIQLPVLTTREKRELDRRLPAGQAISAGDLPFELRPNEVTAYEKHYVFYPMYDEIAI